MDNLIGFKGLGWPRRSHSSIRLHLRSQVLTKQRTQPLMHAVGGYPDGLEGIII